VLLGRAAKDTQEELLHNLCNIISFTKSGDPCLLLVLFDALERSNSLVTLKVCLDAVEQYLIVVGATSETEQILSVL